MKVLLLRGLAREARHWGVFKEKLAQVPGITEVVALDLPGMGSEFQRRTPSNLVSAFEDTRARWLKMRGDSDWLVIGISLGGMVAAAWTTQYPQDFRSMILINSSAANFSPIFHRLRPRNWLRIIYCFLTSRLESREKNILDMTTALLSSDQKKELLPQWVKWAHEFPVKRSNVIRQLWAASRFRAPLKPALPCLVVVSQNDQFTSPRCSFQMAERWGCSVSIHSRAGHDLPLDQTAALVSEVEIWIKKLPGRNL